MRSSILFTGLRSSLRTFRAQFEAARTRHACLAPYATVTAFADALPLSKAVSVADRQAVTAALVAEAARGGSFGATSLLLAYEPLLRSYMRRVPNLPKDDQEQLVVTAFLEAVKNAAKRPAECGTSGYLARATQFQVFHAVVTQAAEPETDAFDDDVTVADPRDLFESPIERRRLAVEILTEATKGYHAADLALIAEAAATGTLLATLVDARHAASSPTVRSAIKQRVQRVRRSLAKTAHAVRSGGESGGAS